MNSDLFIGRRPYPGQNLSIKIDFAAVAGQPIMRDTTDPAKGALSTGPCLGFLTRDVVSGGPSAINRAQLYPGRLELEDTIDGQATLEMWDEIEIEGSTFIFLSGTGELTASTTRGTKVTWTSGKATEVQTGEYAQYQVTDNADLSNTTLTKVTAGNVRLRLERLTT